MKKSNGKVYISLSLFQKNTHRHWFFVSPFGHKVQVIINVYLLQWSQNSRIKKKTINSAFGDLFYKLTLNMAYSNIKLSVVPRDVSIIKIT